MFSRQIIGGMADKKPPSVRHFIRSLTTRSLSTSDFDFDSIAAAATANAGAVAIPDEQWWRKLCKAAAKKTTSAVGGHLLRDKIVHSLTERLAIEELSSVTPDIPAMRIEEPIFVMGLPRTYGNVGSHCMARSGLVRSPKMMDTYSTSLLGEHDREDAFHPLTKIEGLFPDFRMVTQLKANRPSDDLFWHLQTPYSLAWGLLHGLPEFTLECLHEDQAPVFAQVKRCMQVLQWYEATGNYTDAVSRQVEPTGNPIDDQIFGTKHKLEVKPWLVHSPFSILSAAGLHQAFPDMRLIWSHRAISQCVPSLCSSLAIHDSMYTGRRPSETTLAAMGEQVIGMFGSGSEYAIQYLSNFDQKRMAHWSNRDVNRHALRIAMMTLEFFGIEIDKYRRTQGINGHSELVDTYKPKHDAQIPYFGLTESIVNEAFAAYINQFEEFAFEKKIGTRINTYEPLSFTDGRRPYIDGKKEKGEMLVGDAAGDMHVDSMGETSLPIGFRTPGQQQ